MEIGCDLCERPKAKQTRGIGDSQHAVERQIAADIDEIAIDAARPRAIGSAEIIFQRRGGMQGHVTGHGQRARGSIAQKQARRV